MIYMMPVLSIGIQDERIGKGKMTNWEQKRLLEEYCFLLFRLSEIQYKLIGLISNIKRK